MINFCQIAPTAHLNDFCADNNVHLVLAHLVESDPVYADWYAARSEMKILDNSCFEMYKQGRPMYDPDKLITMADKIKADVVVMSDYPNEPSDRTIEAAEYLAPIFKKHGYKTFFVPQSTIGDMEDYIKACEYGAGSSGVDFLGISILGVPNAFGNIERDNKLQRFLSRWKMMRVLQERGLLDTIRRNGKKIHFLGALDGWPGEVELVRDFWGDIFSWDSSGAVWAGLHNIKYDESPTRQILGKFEKEVEFDFVTTDRDLIASAKFNIDVLHSL